MVLLCGKLLGKRAEVGVLKILKESNLAEFHPLFVEMGLDNQAKVSQTTA